MKSKRGNIMDEEVRRGKGNKRMRKYMEINGLREEMEIK